MKLYLVRHEDEIAYEGSDVTVCGVWDTLRGAKDFSKAQWGITKWVNVGNELWLHSGHRSDRAISVHIERLELNKPVPELDHLEIFS